ncbi:hypothetical protein BDF14DRAFT_1773007 [Spinellus fusiger]|nr:hypothetical protein BDF14DRAFT_1773007 [Spinellus fusiger]
MSSIKSDILSSVKNTHEFHALKSVLKKFSKQTYESSSLEDHMGYELLNLLLCHQKLHPKADSYENTGKRLSVDKSHEDEHYRNTISKRPSKGRNDEMIHRAFECICNALLEEVSSPEQVEIVFEQLLGDLIDSVMPLKQDGVDRLYKETTALMRKKADKSKLSSIQRSILESEQTITAKNTESIQKMNEMGILAEDILKKDTERLVNAERFMLNYIYEAGKDIVQDKITTVMNTLKEEIPEAEREQPNKEMTLHIIADSMKKDRLFNEIQSTLQEIEHQSQKASIKDTLSENHQTKVNTLHAQIAEQHTGLKNIKKTIESLISNNEGWPDMPADMKTLEADLTTLLKDICISQLDIDRISSNLQTELNINNVYPTTLPIKRPRSISIDEYEVEKSLKRSGAKQKEITEFLNEYSKTILSTSFPQNLEDIFRQYSCILENHEEILAYLIDPLNARELSPGYVLDRATGLLNESKVAENNMPHVSAPMLGFLRKIADKAVENTNDALWSKVRKIEKEVIVIDRKERTKKKSTNVRNT